MRVKHSSKYGAETSGFSHGKEAPPLLCRAVPLFRQRTRRGTYEDETQTSLQIPLLSNGRAATDPCSHLWLRSFRLQLLPAPEKASLLRGAEVAYLSPNLRSAHCPQETGGVCLAERGLVCPPTAGLAPSRPRLQELLPGACGVSRLQEQARRAVGRIHHLCFYVGWYPPYPRQDGGAPGSALEPPASRGREADHRHRDPRHRQPLLCLHSRRRRYHAAPGDEVDGRA